MGREAWEARWQDYYALLQVQPEAQLEVIEAVYRRLGRIYHPDKTDTGNEETFKVLNDAHTVLSDPARRERYDAAHQQKRPALEDDRQARRAREKPPPTTGGDSPPRPSSRGSGEAMKYAFFCDRCGCPLPRDEKSIIARCGNCGSVLSLEEFYRQFNQQRDQDFGEQCIASSRKKREAFWKGGATSAPILIPVPVDAAHVPQWTVYMTGMLGKYRGTPGEAYFSRLGLDISTNECGNHLYERFFGMAGDYGNPLIFVNTILNTFDHWERITYSDITRVLARMYGEDDGLFVNGMINTGERTVLAGEYQSPPPLALFLESLNFYESGKEPPASQERTYTTRFKQSATRYVNGVLRLANSLYRQGDKRYHALYRWYAPDGTLAWQQEDEWLITSEDSDLSTTAQLGWDHPGNWQPGTHRLVILVDGVIFAQRPFTIEA